MEILKYIKLKNKKFPLVNTPLTDREKWELNKDYGRYVVHDVSSGSYRVEGTGKYNKSLSIDVPFKSIFYFFVCSYALYSFVSKKKKVSKKIKKVREAISPDFTLDKNFGSWIENKNETKEKTVEA